MIVKVHLQANEPRTVTLAGTAVQHQRSAEAWHDSAKGWTYDADTKTAWVKFPDQEGGVKIVLAD